MREGRDEQLRAERAEAAGGGREEAGDAWPGGWCKAQIQFSSSDESDLQSVDVKPDYLQPDYVQPEYVQPDYVLSPRSQCLKSVVTRARISGFLPNSGESADLPEKRPEIRDQTDPDNFWPFWQFVGHLWPIFGHF